MLQHLAQETRVLKEIPTVRKPLSEGKIAIRTTWLHFPGLPSNLHASKDKVSLYGGGMRRGKSGGPLGKEQRAPRDEGLGPGTEWMGGGVETGHWKAVLG